MAMRLAPCVFAAVLGMAAPAFADIAGADIDGEAGRGSSGQTASPQPYLQCVPYARRISGIEIRGDAHTWWSQAEGRYARGRTPLPGAVMAFRPHGNMRLGHVAAVSRVVDSRTVLLRHANWSMINGRRGQIEDNVRAIDVSPGNDWSEVRVWYNPIQALGTTRWPVRGFIYNRQPGREPSRELAPKTELVRSPYYDDPIGEIIAQRLKQRIAAR